MIGTAVDAFILFCCKFTVVLQLFLLFIVIRPLPQNKKTNKSLRSSYANRRLHLRSDFLILQVKPQGLVARIFFF